MTEQRDVAPFVAKLREIVEYGERCSFTRGGTAVLFESRAVFAEQVLPKVRGGE
jgi:hypothetical protein